MSVSLKVLYVEDEDSVRSFIRSFLRTEGRVSVSTASTPTTAIQMIDDALESGDMYDIVILDWWVQDVAGDMQMHTSEPVIKHLQQNKVMSLCVVFTSDPNVNEDMTFGIPVIRKDSQDYLKKRINEVVREKENLLEIMKELRTSINRMRAK